MTQSEPGSINYYGKWWANNLAKQCPEDMTSQRGMWCLQQQTKTEEEKHLNCKYHIKSAHCSWLLYAIVLQAWGEK